MPKYAFKFISGKYQGAEFPMPDEGELVIGRALDLDMMLVEDMVSRKHAKLVYSDNTLIVVDLQSTNGTFVNGEKVRRAELKPNDRLLIGTSILKVIDANELSAEGSARGREHVQAMMRELAKREPQTGGMSGDLEEVPLPDLLQLFTSNKKTGALSVTADGHEGRIFLLTGNLQHVTMSQHPGMPAMKALCRLIGVKRGAFAFDPHADLGDVPASFPSSSENVLMEVMRQDDEMRRLTGQLPSLETSLHLKVPLVPKLTDLTPQELNTLQVVINKGRLQGVLDGATGTDFEALSDVHKLLKAGYLAPL